VARHKQTNNKAVKRLNDNYFVCTRLNRNAQVKIESLHVNLFIVTRVSLFKLEG
jgi:hypothetical protein